MDKKIKEYIGYILTVLLVIVGLNALFGGDAIVVSGYDLLPVLAVITPIYYIAVMRKKSK